jgi:hypothetical protein
VEKSTVIVDSVQITEVVRPRLVAVPGDSIKGELQVQIGDSGLVAFSQSYQSNGIKVKVSGKGTTLKVEAETEPKEVTVYDTEKITKHTRSEKSEKKEVIPERYVPKWVKALAGFGVIALLLIAGFIMRNLKLF